MSDAIPYKQIIDRVKSDIDWIAEQAHAKGYNEAKLIYQNPNAESDYQRGLDDAWETIIKIALIPYAERSEIFDGQQDILSIVQKFSPSEVTAKLREYEQQKADAEIKVGDEVIPIDAIRRPFVVVSTENNVIHGFDIADGYTPRGCHRDETRWEKTGRHFSQVAELLKAMKEGAE